MASTITADDLRALASSAVSAHFEGKGSLTDTVIKVASAHSQPLNAQHVRRVCEMVYHDAYERMYKLASGPDKYVSFDPPNADVAIQRLRSEKGAKTASALPLSAHPTGVSMDKTASAPMHPRKYVPINAFDSLVKSAEAPKVNWENPLGDVYRLRQSVVEAIKDMETRYASLDQNEKHAMFELFDHAAQAAKQGHGVTDVLYACLGGVGDDMPPKVASDVLNEVSAHLGRRGLSLEHTKSAAAEVNPQHPLPRVFAKVASARRDRLEVELGLDDLRRDLKGLDQRISSDLR